MLEARVDDQRPRDQRHQILELRVGQTAGIADLAHPLFLELLELRLSQLLQFRQVARLERQLDRFVAIVDGQLRETSTEQLEEELMYTNVHHAFHFRNSFQHPEIKVTPNHQSNDTALQFCVLELVDEKTILVHNFQLVHFEFVRAEVGQDAHYRLFVSAL